MLRRVAIESRVLQRTTGSLPRLGHPLHRPTKIHLAQQRTFWGSSSPAPEVLELASSSIPSVSPDLTLLILAVVLASSASEEDDVTPPWTVKDLSSSGLGFAAFSNRPIKRGELILAERPLCIWPQGLTPTRAKELFDAMGDTEQKVFMDLSRTAGVEADAMDEILARRATNGFAVQLPVGGNSTVGMVFPKLARINHSCLPNVSQAMNHGTLRMELYSLLDLPSSTEINIEYLPGLILLPHAERQKALKASFGFSQCLCRLCTAPPAVREASDGRRREIKAIGESLGRGKLERQETLDRMERIRVLLDQEGFLGLPEFEDQGVSNAYAVFMTLKAREARR